MTVFSGFGSRFGEGCLLSGLSRPIEPGKKVAGLVLGPPFHKKLAREWVGFNSDGIPTQHSAIVLLERTWGFHQEVWVLGAFSSTRPHSLVLIAEAKIGSHGHT